MSPQRMLGIVLLVVGIILIVIGQNSSHSVADQVTHAVNGRDTDTTIWYMVGGIASALVGLIMTIFGGGSSKNAI